MIAKSESPADRSYPTIYRVSTIRSVMQDFATIHSMSKSYLNRIFPYKPSILGVPPFMETPMSSGWQFLDFLGSEQVPFGRFPQLGSVEAFQFDGLFATSCCLAIGSSDTLNSENNSYHPWHILSSIPKSYIYIYIYVYIYTHTYMHIPVVRKTQVVGASFFCKTMKPGQL